MTLGTETIDGPPPSDSSSETTGPVETTTITDVQEPLSFHDRTLMMNYLQEQRGLTAEQASNFVDNVMQPDEVRRFLGVITGQNPITRQELVEDWGLSEEQADFVLQGEESLSLTSSGEGKHGGVLVTSHPFGSIFVEFMALMYSLGTDVRQMLAKMIKLQKEGMIDSANSQFQGAIAKFSAAMFAGVVSLGGGMANAMRTKNKPPAQATANPDASSKKNGAGSNPAQDPVARRNNEINEAINNTWTSPQGLSLITQPFTAAGDFTDAWFQRDAARTNAEVEEARAIFQQLMSFYEQTKNSQQSAAQGAA